MYYIPNFPDLGNPAWIAPKPKHEGIIIGWGGGGTHKQSIRDSNVLTALQLICREFPQVRIMICGNEPYAKKKLAEMLKIPAPPQAAVKVKVEEIYDLGAGGRKLA